MSYSKADAVKGKIIPAVISPGDFFAIRLTGFSKTEAPSVVFDNRQIRFDSCGKGCYIALCAADIEMKPGVYYIGLDAERKKIKLKVVIRKPDFPVLHLTLPEEKVFPSTENLDRAVREENKLKALWQTYSDRIWDGDFIMPLGNEISTVFGAKRIMNEKKISIHRGVDIKGKAGEEVRASNAGRVLLAEELFFGGNTIILDHGRGIFTVYMHLSAYSVKPDNIVSKGDVIGLVGSSGRASGPHLHFGVKFQDLSTNPVSLVRLKL